MKLIYRCANSAEASVVLNALMEAGIPAVEGESGTSSVFPLPNFGPTIYVDDKNVDRAIELLGELERQTLLTQKNESFREVDHQEIDYLQTVHDEKGSNIWIWVLAFIMLLGLFRAILHANGQGNWFSRIEGKRFRFTSLIISRKKEIWIAMPIDRYR